MNLFSRRRKPAPVLDEERLAEAIAFSSLDLEAIKNKTLFTRESAYNLKLGDHLCLAGNCRFFKSSQTDYPSSYSLMLETYVDNIHMADYQFKIYIDVPSWRDFNEEWECKKLNIIHEMPEQFIELMNTWSSQVLEEKYQQEAFVREEQAKKQKQEEQRLEEERAYLMQFR